MAVYVLLGQIALSSVFLLPDMAFCCAGDEVEGGGGEEEAEGGGEEAPECGLLADGVDAPLAHLVPGGDDKHGVVEHVGRHGHPYRTAP